jgi:putative pyrroloquinoline-quinone binding quinoprotein
VLYGRAAPVRGRLLGFGNLLFATIDLRPGQDPVGGAERTGLAAFDRETGEELWRRLALPPLVARDEEQLYAYGRGGVVVAVGFDGEERWRASVPDDRSELSRRRRDRDGPVPADVVPIGAFIVVAARGELFVLSYRDGSVLASRSVCAGPGGMVTRLAYAGDALVCSCSSRSRADDDPAATERRLLDAPRTLESLRTGRGDLVSLSRGLEERWRVAPPAADLVWGERLPVRGPRGLVFAATATAIGSSLSSFGDRLVGVDYANGAVAFVQPMTGGRGLFDPLVVGEEVLAGFEPTLYSADGLMRRRLPASLRLDVSVRPALDDGGIVFVADSGRLVAVVPGDGEPRAAATFAKRLPFTGVVTTTELLVADGLAYLAVKEAGTPTELRALRLEA